MKLKSLEAVNALNYKLALLKNAVVELDNVKSSEHMDLKFNKGKSREMISFRVDIKALQDLIASEIVQTENQMSKLGVEI